MLFTPDLKFVQFSELQPGDILIYLASTKRRYTAMKVAGPAPSDAARILILSGPHHGTDLPHVTDFRSEHVLRLPGACVLELTVSGADWLKDVPEGREACILLSRDKAFMRVNIGRHSGFFEPAWVALEDGALQPGRPEEPFAVTTQWRIVLPDGPREPKVVVDSSRLQSPGSEGR